MAPTETPSHFKGKEAIEHVVEMQAQGMIDAAEVHGSEIPGHISAAADAARETALVVLLFWTFLYRVDLTPLEIGEILAIFALGWTLWKCGRSAWLGWSRLERLHRVLEQEKWEIEHNRPQERAELTELYEAKGFQGKLLEDVIDVLMADGDRLLRVMVEEELGLSLHSQEHPLKQALGAAVGAVIAILLCGIAYVMAPNFGIVFGALASIALAAFVAAYHEQNRLIPAVVWNLGIAIAAYGSVYFLLEFVERGV